MKGNLFSNVKKAEAYPSPEELGGVNKKKASHTSDHQKGIYIFEALCTLRTWGIETGRRPQNPFPSLHSQMMPSFSTKQRLARWLTVKMMK